MNFVISCGDGNTTGQARSFGRWAAAREAEGWHGVAVGEHVNSGGFWAHPFVALGEMAGATTTVRLATAFANNLLRSPVRFAQAALTMHDVSGGRFDAGIGAGWQRDEIDAIGFEYPMPSARAARYRDAFTIVRDLLHTGACEHHGPHYDIDIRLCAPPTTRPPLVGAVAGPWTTRAITPLADRVEVLPLPKSSRGGAIDLTELAALDRSALRESIDRVKQHDSEVATSLLLFVDVVDDADEPAAGEVARRGVAADLHGPAPQVADALLGLADLGLDQITLIPLRPDTETELAEHLFA